MFCSNQPAAAPWGKVRASHERYGRRCFNTHLPWQLVPKKSAAAAAAGDDASTSARYIYGKGVRVSQLSHKLPPNIPVSIYQPLGGFVFIFSIIWCFPTTLMTLWSIFGYIGGFSDQNKCCFHPKMTYRNWSINNQNLPYLMVDGTP